MARGVANIGKDAIKALRDYLHSVRPETIFLVRGGNSFSECGAEDVIWPIIKSLGAELISFSDFSSNPKTEDVKKGLDIIKKNKPEIILAIGGGSVMDMAKLIRFFYSYSKENGTYIQTNSLIPLIAIPTTAGTGSETTHFAVMYVDGVKTSIEHETVRPDYAFVYPPFTYHNNPYLTACTGFDALAQAIESFWNKNASSESDELAKKAISLLWPNLHKVVNEPTVASRDAMSLGSYLAGRAIDITKTTAPHAFSYGLTSLYGYPHGHAVAVCFPQIMRHNLNNDWLDNAKKNKLAELIGCSDYNSADDRIESLIKGVGLFVKSIDYDFVLLSQKINSSRLANNPCNIGMADIKNIYEQSLKV